MREAFQHRTRRALAATTPLHRGEQFRLHPLKVGELLPDLGEMLSRQGVDLGAGQMRVFRQMQKAADFGYTDLMVDGAPSPGEFNSDSQRG
jgi:hypothetical protein